MARIISIDPGLDGAIAAFDDKTLIDVADIPTTEYNGSRSLDLAALSKQIHEFIADETEVRFVIERQQSMPRQGVASTFKTGQNYGTVLGICCALGHEPTILRPQAWKRCYPSLEGMGRDAQKTVARRLAVQKYPQHETKFKRVKDHDRAEAVLMGLAAQ